MDWTRRVPLPYWLLLPTIAYLVVFFVVPLAQTALLSVRAADGAFTWNHVQRMLDDIYFTRAVRNTLILTVTVVPLQLVLAFLVALLVNQRFGGSTFFLYVYAIPLGISDLAAGLVWLSIFTERGYLNSLLYRTEWIERPLVFLSHLSPEWVYRAIVVTEIWRATPIVMIILLAGLQMVNREYAEAADVFGATWWQKVRYVIIPLLKPSIQTALIIRTMLAFQVFGPVLVLSGRLYPVLAGESYFWYVLIRNEHVAAAYAMLLMLVSMAVTWMYLVFLRTRDEQAGVA